MDKYFESEWYTGTYRSRDVIDNLKVKITIQKLSASTVGFVNRSNPNADRQDLDTTNFGYNLNEYGQEIFETQEVEIKWKEKLFSKREMEFYSEESNCSTFEDYKYHNAVKEIEIGESRRNDRIFTYRDNDRLALATEYEPMTTRPTEEATYLTEMMSGLRRRRANELGRDVWKINKGAISGVNVVIDDPTDEFKEVHHVIDTPVQTFVIMADLGDDKVRGRAEDEYRLCTIEYDNNYVLRVTPDFSQTKLPYRVKDSGGLRAVWNFNVEHSSNKIGKIQSKNEIKSLLDRYELQREYLVGLVGDEFETISDNLLRLVAHGEVVSAENFRGGSKLHVEYFLDAPSGWTSDPSQMFFGCTHACECKEVEGSVETAHFTQPFSYQLYYNMNKNKPDSLSPDGWPRLYVHVLSTNAYGKTSSEGYGYGDFPVNPGRHTIHINCWRPLAGGGYDNVLAEMRRLFIDYSPQLDDITFIGPNNRQKDKPVSKYMVRTESTGRVTITMNCIHQCNQFQSSDDTSAMPTFNSKKRLQLAAQKARMLAKNDVTSTVIDAYRQARKRMQLAREKTPMRERLDTILELAKSRRTANAAQVENIDSKKKSE